MISENGEWLDMVPPLESPYCEKIVTGCEKAENIKGCISLKCAPKCKVA